QIDAFVYRPRNGGETLATVEFIQERSLERGNKWGAWFRNDLEIFPGPVFRWNGAMHTEGSLIIREAKDKIPSLHLISAPKSCIYTRTASEITAAEVEGGFQGQFVAGTLQKSNIGDRTITTIHSYNEPPNPPYTSGDADPPNQNVTFTKDRDSVGNGVNPSEIALNPVKILTEDKSEARGSDPTNRRHRDSNWVNQFYVIHGRIGNKAQAKPYVDDTYRADDRYGPKPSYDKTVPATDPQLKVPEGQMGQQITSNPRLTRNVADSSSPDKRTDLGLDGYWERRSRQEGLRIIVGERLELGKPLDPPDHPNPLGANRRNEFYQHRTLRDNLAAVQATAIYHYKAAGNTVKSDIPDPFTEPYAGQDVGGYEPIACLATTYHHGTPQTALRSIMFNQYSETEQFNNSRPLLDFFTGRGTNGWEFEPPNRQDLQNPNSPLRKALRNLANNFSDPDGAFPPKQETNTIHPDPDKVKYGNFSNLRRALDTLEERNNDMSRLSLADQSTIHTAACTLQMLAYSIKTIDNVRVNPNDPPLRELARKLRDLDNDNDSQQRSPYEYIYRLAGRKVGDPLPPLPDNLALVQWARLIALREQIKRDLDDGYRCNLSGDLEKLCPKQNLYKDVFERVFGDVLPENIQGIPRALSDFKLPYERPREQGLLPNRLNQIVDAEGRRVNVAFLDNALFNGREEMAVREMDIDLDLLRRSPIGGDTWLPMGGIVYAFREDAVREDAIARPKGPNWMNTDPNNPHDPAPINGISPKPVDFFPDPMRRPNGFRLWNGSRLDRQGLPASKNIAGLSFISDNPVYIQGNFNLHSTDGTTNNLIEEFTEKLQNDWDNFYSRNTLDTRFARPESDTWRPAEILADAITILSDNFCNGSAQDYFAEAGNLQGYNGTGKDAKVANNEFYPTCSQRERTSFLNANRPKTPLDSSKESWARENPFDPSSPIYVDRNGIPWAVNHQNGQRIGVSNSYYTFSDDRPRNGAQDTRVNAVFVSGIVPSRPNQSYGGMHNFPRFLEKWGNLWIQGSFIQLNFSTQATAPFDQDQWELNVNEPSDSRCRNVNTAFNCPATNAELIKYYGAPNRRWGYDVALQLAPAGPVASRFISPGRQRSEYFTELPADDPYILRLRCAQRPEGMGDGRIDPGVINCPA
uniref:hormogonium polysaccharide biosynthesis protein HpsA n=1 Tax=uncultured Thermosynechococcus sp. TaxID=436945 RepID=UPI002631EFA1